MTKTTNPKTRKTTSRLTWLIVYALTIALASVIFLYEIPLPDARLSIASVAYTETDASHPGELSQANWVHINLPDNWEQRDVNASNVWYRATFRLDETPKQLWAVLIPSVKMNAAVYLNGKLLGSGGRFTDPVARNWMTPLLFSIPYSLLREGDNTLYIRVKSDPPGSGQLSALQLAPYESLKQAYDTHYLFRITSIQIITSMLLAMGALIGMLWIARRQETYYGYYALAVIIWGVHNFNIFIVEIPFSTRMWDWLAYTTIGYYAFLSMIFIHRFLEKSHPRIERTVIATGLSIAALLLFLEDRLFYAMVYQFWYPAIYGVGLYVLTYTFVEAWKQQSIELQFLAATGSITLLYASHDLLLMHNLVNWEDGYYIQYAAAVLLALFSFILLRRYASSLNSIDQLNKNLERRVAEKHSQLEDNYRRLRQMEHERILAEERERLTRDIHDGMGGNLVSTLAMIESGNANIDDITTALKDSLDDLRLMIDSMGIQEDDLATLLGMFRMRISQRLKNSHIDIEWQVEDLPTIPNFGPRQALHVLRILQEAVTNTIRHAQADTINLSTCLHGNETGGTSIIVTLKDNGVGMQDTKTCGNGITNMYHRARMAGGSLKINSSNAGTSVQLTLPLASPSPNG